MPPAPHSDAPAMQATHHRMRRLFPFLAWPRPDATLLRQETLAGATVGLMVIPQGVAYAALAGMPLVTGIYAALLPALVAVLFGASVRLSVGPTALTSLLVMASLSGLAEPGSAQWVSLAVWLALLTGAMQVALGFMRFGWLLNLVNAPVLTAFTQAAAVLILLSQLPDLLGLTDVRTHGWLHALTQPLSLSSFNLPAAAAGLGALALLVLARRLRPTFPSVLLVMLGSAGLAWLLAWDAAGVPLVGTLPAGLPSPYWPDWPTLAQWQQLVLPVGVITLVSFLETASSAKVDNGRQGKPWDQDQDLVGQGLAKIASGLTGAFPTSSSFGRSALNLYAGAQTGWATLASVGVVALALLLLMPVLRWVPQATLAAVVVVAVMGLIKPREFTRLWRIDRVEASIALVTFGVTLLAAPRLYWGVLTGMLMSLSHFLYQHLHPRIIEVGLHPDGSLRDRHLWHLPPLAAHTYALRMDAELDFAASAAFERNVMDFLASHPDTRHVCLVAQPINRIDATGTDTLLKLLSQLQAQGVAVHISGIKLPVEQVLRRAGGLQPSPWLHLYRTDAEALAALSALAPLPPA